MKTLDLSEKTAPATEPPTTAPLIFKAMIGVMSDIDAVSKDRTSVGKFSFKYRGIDDVFNALHAAMAKHGVFMTQDVLAHTIDKIEGKGPNDSLRLHHLVEVIFSFHAMDGSKISCCVRGECMANDDKGYGKAMSYALKTCLLQTFLIPTEDDSKDPDSTNEPIYRGQPQGQRPYNQPQGQQRPPQRPEPAKTPLNGQEIKAEIITESQSLASPEISDLKADIIATLNTLSFDWQAKTGKNKEYLIAKVTTENDIEKLKGMGKWIGELLNKRE
jgi:hypothetical protein